MADFIVPDLDENLHEQLLERARLEGRSVEEMVRSILHAAVTQRGSKHAEPLGQRIAARFRGVGLEDEISELRGYSVNPPELSGE